MKKLSFIITVLILSISMLFSSCQDIDKSNESNNGTSGIETTKTDDIGSEATSATVAATTAVSASDSAHVHSYGEWVTVMSATCQKEGSRARVCKCGAQDVEVLKKLECSYVQNVCTMCNGKEPLAFVPDYTAGKANVVGSCNAALNYTAQDRYIYCSNENKLQKAKKNADAVETVYTVSSGNVFNVNVIGDWIYFYCGTSTVAKSYIAKVRTDGSGFEKLVSSVGVYEMLVVKDTVYYTTVTEDWTYDDYRKDVFPLYSVSVNGGTPKQIHDGAVENLTADETYLYFSHETEDDVRTVCRLKHSNMSKSVLFKGESRGLSLENSKLYFFVIDKYDVENLTLASITTSGASYTTYGKVHCIEATLHVIGNKAYFVGSAPFSEENPKPEFGLIEYDMKSKTFKLIREYEDYIGFVGVFDLLILENYNYDSERLESIEIYVPTVGAFKKIKMTAK